MDWKDVLGFEGYYQVNSLGEVKSFDRKLKNGNGYYIKLGRILKPCVGGRGYLAVNLCKDKKSTKIYIHRIVAQAFIPNLDNKIQVNHINGIKSDNNKDNLEWVTNYENIQHAKINGLLYTRPIIQYTLDGDIIKVWNSISEAADILSLDKSHIVKCCKGKIKYHGKFIFNYK